MSTTGPTKEVKIAGALHDTSHLLIENWAEIGRNFILVIIIGITVWLFCSTLRLAVEHSTEYLFAPFHGAGAHVTAAIVVLLVVLLLSGLLRGWLVSRPAWKDAEGDGAGTSIAYFHKTYSQNPDIADVTAVRYRQPAFMAALRRIVMTILTVGMGGSGGIEGPVIPIGESLGAGWSRIFRIKNPHDLRVLQMAGIAAAIATLLNAPFTGALFAGEVVFTERLVYRTLLYSMIAAVTAYTLNNHFLHFAPLFSIAKHTHVYAPREYIEVSLVAIICSAPAGLGVNYVLKVLGKFMHLFPTFLRAAIGALCVGGIAMFMWFSLHIGPDNVLGISEGTLKELISGTGPAWLSVWWILLLLAAAKLFATGFTYAAGGSTGLLIPAMYMGG
ncbi:MAG: chloride channel protein, partial [Gammaproteobacteria bacterium]|nr:chloride channel protein [Gammaproteobacteria bacterium]